jgi:hypothetical protein
MRVREEDLSAAVRSLKAPREERLRRSTPRDLTPPTLPERPAVTLAATPYPSASPDGAPPRKRKGGWRYQVLLLPAPAPLFASRPWINKTEISPSHRGSTSLSAAEAT